MFSFFHWLVLSVVVRLPRVLPMKWAQSLLVQFCEVAPRSDWQKYSSATIMTVGRQDEVFCEIRSWTDGTRIFGNYEKSPLLVYLWRCTTPYGAFIEDSDRAAAAVREADWAAQAAADREREEEWARQEAALAEADEADEADEAAAWEAEMDRWAEVEAMWEAEAEEALADKEE